MTDPDLIRFLDAQDQIYAQVVDELTNGRKQTHWMWLVFPQLAGLGQSAMAQHYAIRDLDQARRYLADSILTSEIGTDGAYADDTTGALKLYVRPITP